MQKDRAGALFALAIALIVVDVVVFYSSDIRARFSAAPIDAPLQPLPAPDPPFHAAQPERAEDAQPEVQLAVEKTSEPQRISARRARVERKAPVEEEVAPLVEQSPLLYEPKPGPEIVSIADTTSAQPMPQDTMQKATEVLAPKKSEPVPESGIEVVFRADIDWLRTGSLELLLDGRAVARKARSDGLPTRDGLALYTGELIAGTTHQLTLHAKMIGNGGVFSYFDGYTFTLKQHTVFTVEPDENARVVITAIERGGLSNDWSERVGLKVDITTSKHVPNAQAAR